jgi:hypothetical protein
MTIQCRALSPSGDVMRGSGLQNFVTDLDAVAVILLTTIRLLQGEVFYALNVGTPLFQQLLGHPVTTGAVALVLRQAILGVPYVTGISSFQCSYLAAGRALSFSATVTTAFGPLQISNQQPPAFM